MSSMLRQRGETEGTRLNTFQSAAELVRGAKLKQSHGSRTHRGHQTGSLLAFLRYRQARRSGEQSLKHQPTGACGEMFPYSNHL